MTAHSMYQYFQILAVACPNYLLLLAVMLYSVGLSNHSLSPVYPCCCHPAACTTLLLLILLMFSNTRRWKIWSDHCGYWYCQHTHSRWKKAITTTIIISWSIQFHGKINLYRILTLFFVWHYWRPLFVFIVVVIDHGTIAQLKMLWTTKFYSSNSIPEELLDV